MSYFDVPNASKGITKEDVLTFLNDIRSRKEFNQLSYGENTDVQTYASQFYNYMDLKYLLKTLQIIILHTKDYLSIGKLVQVRQ